MTDIAETLVPTAERIAHAGEFMEHPEISQVKSRRAYRVVSLVAGLHSRGSIDDRCLTAYQRFERDWETGHRSPSCVAGYGERLTSAGDMADGGEIKKANAYRRSRKALEALGSPHAKLALMMLVSVRPADAISTVRPYSLEEIGRACSSYTARVAAITAGSIVLRDALYQLHLHYDEG